MHCISYIYMLFGIWCMIYCAYFMQICMIRRAYVYVGHLYLGREGNFWNQHGRASLGSGIFGWVRRFSSVWVTPKWSAKKVRFGLLKNIANLLNDLANLGSDMADIYNK